MRRRSWLATIPAALGGVFLGRASAQARPSRVFLPTALDTAAIPAAIPGDITIPLPFPVLDSPVLNPILDEGDWWRVVVYRVDSGNLNGGYPLRVNVRTGEVQVLDQMSVGVAADTAQTRAIGPLSPTQLNQVRGPDGRWSYWYLQSTTGRARSLVVKVQK